MTKLSLSFLTVCVVLNPLSAQAAEQVFCEDYAREMINIPQHREGAPKTCHKDQAYWNTDKAAHIKWCQGVSEADANKKRYNHNNLVNLCNDSYKLILIDRKRLASLPISATEEMQMDSAPKDLTRALVNGKIQSPYASLFPTVDAAIKSGSLKQCAFDSLSVEIDKNTKTKEWVISTDVQCLEEKPFGHVWLIQQIDDQYRVLFEGEHNTLNLRISEKNNYKIISISSALSRQQETKQRCGRIEADWHYVEGRYIPFKGKANEMGQCLPEYNLPDYLQGVNTYDLAEGEWEKGMEAEEEKRKALMTPYKKALQDYVPTWIASVEKRVPSNSYTINTVQALDKSSGQDEPIKTSSHSSKDEDKSKDQDKSFLETMRAFLGLD